MKDDISAEGGGAKTVESEYFEGGNGFYVRKHNDTFKETGISSVVKSGDKLISCAALTNDDKPLKPADACKTLRAM